MNVSNITLAPTPPPTNITLDANATIVEHSSNRLENVERFTFLFVLSCMMIILAVLYLVRRSRESKGYKVTAKNEEQQIELINNPPTQEIHFIEQTYEYK